MNRGAAAEIDLSALKTNLAVIRKITGDGQIIGVVKADAYGHGAAEMAKRLVSEGVSTLAVAFVGEAAELRSAGVNVPIIVLFDRTDIASYFDLDLIPVLHDIETARAFSAESRRKCRRLAVHVKVDTGMGRVGLLPDRAVTDALEIASFEGLDLAGLMSHFSEADLSDLSYADFQIKLFSDIRRNIIERLGRPVIAHMANSAAVLTLNEAAFDAVRPGIMLYGCSPIKDDAGLRPLMRIRTRVLVVRNVPSGTPISYGRTFVTNRPSRIAVLSIGYADGFNRLFSNNAEVLIRGRRVPVAGRVCMDLTMADVTDADGVSEGDEAVILGSQGEETITASEMARRINTIPYEILTGLGSRARREFIQ